MRPRSAEFSSRCAHLQSGKRPSAASGDLGPSDAVFLGDKHSNHSDTAPKTLRSDPEDSPALPGGRAHHRAGGQRLFRSEADGGLGGHWGWATSRRASSMTICRALSPGSGNRPGGPIKTGIKSGGTWSWGTGGATGRSFGGRCFASRFMRIGNVCWSLPARIRSCTPI